MNRTIVKEYLNTGQSYTKWKNGLTISNRRVESNPHMPDPDMRHWKATLRGDKKSYTLVFSQGSAHTKEPSIYDILTCLRSDYIEPETSFENFCSDTGYETDSLRALKIFKAVRVQSEKVRKFIGPYLETFLQDESLS